MYLIDDHAHLKPSRSSFSCAKVTYVELCSQLSLGGNLPQSRLASFLQRGMAQPLADMSSTASFPFLKLPTEIRFIIYQELLVNCQCLGDKPHCHVNGEIAFTCREVFKEVRHMSHVYRSNQHVHVNIHLANILIYLPVPRPLNLVWLSHRSGSFPALLSSFKDVIITIGNPSEVLTTALDNTRFRSELRRYAWHLWSQNIVLHSVNLRIGLHDSNFLKTCMKALKHRVAKKVLVNGKEASE